MVDESQHELVPEHTVLPDDEVEDVLDEYEIEPTDLPKIKLADPALPDNAEEGDVIEIERNSRTTETAIVYRLVIE